MPKRYPVLLPSAHDRLSASCIAVMERAIGYGDWTRTPEGHPVIEWVALREGEYEWRERT